MQLRQAHALGVFDDHQGGIGHIYADFDDGGGDQDVQPPRRKPRHHFGLFGGLHAPVYQSDIEFGQCRLKPGEGFGGGLQLQGFAFFNQWADPIRLPPFSASAEDEAFDFGAADVVDEARFNRCAPGRQFVDDGHVQIGEKTHRKRARDGRGGHHQLMDFAPFVFEGEALGNAETVLFVHNGQAQIVKRHAV
ncbi:Uncharacterised protein [Neisseria meningitidis]|nr:Uncharacterised protein [Neisseria meningitidis]